MSSGNKRKSYVALLIIAVLGLTFGMLYYVSTDSYKERTEVWQKSTASAIPPSFSKIIGRQAVLIKNKNLRVGRTELVYRGLDGKNILLDLYLLDLDSEQAYPLKIARKTAKEQVKIGGIVYRLLSVNNRSLKLEILHMP